MMRTWWEVFTHRQPLSREFPDFHSVLYPTW